MMLTSTPNQHSNLTQNQPSSRRNSSHCQLTMRQPNIHMSLQHASTTLAIKYQTRLLTRMTFLRWTWTVHFESPLAKSFNVPRP